MRESESKITEKIEKLLALSESDNEHEAKSAMLKARELMARHKISGDQVRSSGSKERPVIYLSAGPFRDKWIGMIATLIAENFCCRCIETRRSDKKFRLRFYGYEEDAEICMNIFRHAVKTVRTRFLTLHAIYREAGKEFGENEKWNYVIGFCHGLEKNFEEQKKQSQAFALALAVPKAVDDYVGLLPGLEQEKVQDIEMSEIDWLIYRHGRMDGKAFQNAGDREKIGKDGMWANGI